MIVTKGFRKEEFEKLLAINDSCYTGVERPTLQEFENMLKHTDIFVARVDNDGDPYFSGDRSVEQSIIGFAIVRHANLSEPYLWSIAVNPHFQGRGVGGNLLREIIKAYTLNKNSQITLHVHPDNPAQKLYFDYGFRVTAIARKWFMEGGYGLVMRRTLP